MSPHMRHRLTLEIECPRCKSKPGKRCTGGMFHGEVVEMWTPCEERIEAAKAVSPPVEDAEQRTVQRILAYLRDFRTGIDRHNSAPGCIDAVIYGIEDGAWKE